jgi:hypothetical protein
MLNYSPCGTSRPDLWEDENYINETKDPDGSLDDKSLYDYSNKYLICLCEHIIGYSNSAFIIKKTSLIMILVLSYPRPTIEDKYAFLEDCICHLQLACAHNDSCGRNIVEFIPDGCNYYER